MFRSYFKIAVRNLSKNKIFSFTSIAGFTAGLCIVINIFLYIKNEMSYDSFHRNSNSIYRVLLHSYDTDWASISPFISNKLKEQFPQIQLSSNYLDRITEIKVQKDINKERVAFADKEFFRMFSFDFIEGNGGSFFSNPSSVFITRSFSEKYFGSLKSMNKRISVRIENEFCDFLVAGILEDIPENSSLKFNIIIPFENVEKTTWLLHKDMDIEFMESFPSFFVLLKNSSDKEVIEQKFNSFIKEIIKSRNYINNNNDLVLSPLADIHFNQNIKFSTLETADSTPLYILSIIAVMIVVIVSFNYINLSITQSSFRFKEVGIRKITGAKRINILYQFLVESFLIVSLSISLAVVFAEFSLPLFNRIFDKHLSLNQDFYIFLAFLPVLAIIVSLVSGLYPALVISRHKPAFILKGNNKLNGIRPISKIFLSVQFIFAIVLLSGTVIINSQYNFLVSKDPGFNKEFVLAVKANELFGRSIPSDKVGIFKNEIMKNPLVAHASSTNIKIGEHDSWGPMGFIYKSNTLHSRIMDIDENFIPALNLKMTRGRNFNREISADTISSIIVNEEFIKQLSITDPLNEAFHYLGLKRREVQIVGVIKNFNYFSLKENIIPLALRLTRNDRWSENIYIKYSSGNIHNIIKQLEDTWYKVVGDYSFEYAFLDEMVARLYSSEERWKNIITYTSYIAVFFSALGLFAFVFYSAQRRTKEIGIRKVLGASIYKIITLLAYEYIVIVFISIIVGSTITYIYAKQWLQNFAYKINLQFELFLIAAIIIIIISLLTLFLVAFKAARSNPVKSLRYE